MIVINWQSVEKTPVQSADEWNNIITNDLKDLTFIQVPKTKKALSDFKKCYGHYYAIQHTNYIELRVCDKCPRIYYYGSSTDALCNNGTVPEINGFYAYIQLDKLFREEYNTCLKNGFLSKDQTLDEDSYIKIKKCVPCPINYYNKQHADYIIEHCYKNDVSSAYPSAASGKLPTLKDCKVVEGKVEPNEEYPFAFYTKSHHFKVLNEFSTEDFMKSPYYIISRYNNSCRCIRYPSVTEEETILCKESGYTLKNVMQTLYNGRKENANYKAIMNMSIGYFHRNDKPELSHVAAVILGRCVNRMINYANDIQSEGNTVLLINTDAVGWKGKYYSKTDEIKKLGAFNKEYEDAKFFIMGSKKYQIETKEGIVKTIWAGVLKEKTENYKLGDIFDSDEVPIVNMFDSTTGKLITKEVDEL